LGIPHQGGADRNIPPPPRGASTRVLWLGLAARGAILHAWRSHLLELSRLSERLPEIRELVDSLQRGSHVGRHSNSTLADVFSNLKDSVAEKIDRIVEDAEPDSDIARLGGELRLALGQAEPAEPFKAMLDRVCEYSRSLYGHRWMDPEHDYSHTHVHPRRTTITEDPYTVRASCDVSDPRKSLVTIVFYPPLLGCGSFREICVIGRSGCKGRWWACGWVVRRPPVLDEPIPTPRQ
jgi:hypothetical protein